MPIDVRWDDSAQTVIRWDYEADWTWHDAALAAEQTREMRQQRHDLPVMAIILNMHSLQTIPRDSLRNMRRLMQAVGARDIIILNGSNPAVSVMTAFTRAIFQNAAEQIYTTATLEDARRLSDQLLHPNEHDAPTKPSRPTDDSDKP
jgi:hypothetical protein